MIEELPEKRTAKMPANLVFAGGESAVASTFEKPMLELVPHGIVMGVIQTRPLLLLKSTTTEDVMPVFMTPIQMPVLLSEMGQVEGGERVHILSLKILQKLSTKITRCIFVDLSGLHQFVDVYFETSSEDGGPLKSDTEFAVRCRADEAIPLVVAQKAKFFASREFIERCRSIQLDSKDFMMTQGMHQELSRDKDILLQ